MPNLKAGLAGRSLAPIEVLRACLFSGGQFLKTGVDKSKVAEAIHSGFADGLAAGTSGLTLIEYENGAGEFVALVTAAAAAPGKT